ncbi:hypothetical protein DVH02_18585 [Streptomyces corynorhini]|uniref:Uncharacterized protein n=1 Tax=Streptomyces corynorhini TaxID=2282652 RepID=A0A370B4H2_9ACTN|nr:hypothetical protein DVH02_18585 [Streptomyces corynorhini]
MVPGNSLPAKRRESHPLSDTHELHTLVGAGGFHRLTPDWWPDQEQFATPDRPLLLRVEAALKARLTDGQ